jgi:hypothetical protein
MKNNESKADTKEYTHNFRNTGFIRNEIPSKSIPIVTIINIGGDTRSCMLFSKEPSRGHPTSQEKTPTMIIPIPNIAIRVEPLRDSKDLGSNSISDTPNNNIKTPEGIKPAKFISSVFDVPVAPSSLMNCCI